MMQSTTPALRRPIQGRTFAGVCEGLARFFNIDVTLIRLGLVFFTLLGGSGILAYLIAWYVIPDETGQRATAPLIIAIALVAIPLACAFLGAFAQLFFIIFAQPY